MKSLWGDEFVIEDSAKQAKSLCRLLEKEVPDLLLKLCRDCFASLSMLATMESFLRSMANSDPAPKQHLSVGRRNTLVAPTVSAV